ncbi:MAG: CotH kinase family protein [Thermoanaerobaculia bacterium]|nr:CotH kinase family protein [Thermoanaerobaculia bacterium]
MKNLLFALIALLPLAGFAQNTKTVRPLFDKKTIGEIRLTLPAKNWADALDSMRLYGEGMMVGTALVDGQKYENVGVRFRGNKSYQVGIKRNPFQIKLNYSNTEQNHQGYTSLKLSAAKADPSMVREVLFHEIAAKYMPSSQTAYTKLFVNEEYAGIFINLESVDGQFLDNHFGSRNNPFFKAGVDYKPEPAVNGCKQNIFGSLEYEENIDCYRENFTLESDRGWADLQELTRILNNEPAKIERVLDVDRTLWMLALNNVMVNLSSYSGQYSVNYYLYKDNNGRFQPVHWDLNLSFGSFKNTGNGSDLDLRNLQRLDPLLHADNPYKPLISQLLKDNLYRKIYLAHLRQINDENFATGAYEKRAKELQAMIAVPFNDDKNKLYSIDDFQKSLNETIGRKSKIPGIAELMSKRSRFLKTHPELTALPSAISDVSVQGRGKFENQRINTFRIVANADRFPKKLLIYYRFADNQPYASMVMTEETSGDLPSGMKTFSANIEAKTDDAVLDYYIMAENAGTVSFSPMNYFSKPYKIKLSDLNK